MKKRMLSIFFVFYGLSFCLYQIHAQTTWTTIAAVISREYQRCQYIFFFTSFVMWQAAIRTMLLINAANPLTMSAAGLVLMSENPVIMCAIAARKYIPLAASCSFIRKALRLKRRSLRRGYLITRRIKQTSAAIPVMV